MVDRCSIEGCDRKVFDGRRECVLHCTKSNYAADFREGSILKKFYTNLVDYICKDIDDLLTKNGLLEHDKLLKGFLTGDLDSDVARDIFKETTVVFDGIFFPGRDSRDRFDYLNILKKLGEIHFNYCRFSATLLDLPDSKLFYQDCEFFQSWHVTQSFLLDNVDDVLFQRCEFSEKVFVYLEDELGMPLFRDCNFKHSLTLEGADLTDRVFNNSESETQEIKTLEIRNCTVHEEFVLNNLRTDYFLLEDSKFKSKVELKEGIIGEVRFLNSSFDSIFDSYKTSYRSFYCFKGIFRDFVGFEQCRFAEGESQDRGIGIAVFEYVTFLGFTNFRGATFFQGLDLESTNLKEAPNFLKLQLHSNNTNRETLRIIKHSFDRIGNHIEANRFFVKEMNKYKEELGNDSSIQERLIFWLNKVISNFGQSYVLPIVWIIVFSMLFQLLVIGYEANFLYRIYEPLNPYISQLSSGINTLAQSIIPFSKFLKEGMEFISLVFYVIFASLVWQTVIAIKRYTKR